MSKCCRIERLTGKKKGGKSNEAWNESRYNVCSHNSSCKYIINYRSFFLYFLLLSSNKETLRSGSMALLPTIGKICAKLFPYISIMCGPCYVTSTTNNYSFSDGYICQIFLVIEVFQVLQKAKIQSGNSLR